ncbi:MAG: ATP-dependent zinc metalloprotease FtsH [Phycisphaerales bacterium]|nr:ATP-dependent zinc metalloprotease FtsH [Phycisphaerales bacterium]
MADEENQSREPRSPSGGPGGKPPMRVSRGAFGWLVIFGLAMTLLFMLNRGLGSAVEISTNAFWTHVKNGNVESVVVKDGLITGKFRTPPPSAPTGVKSFECSYLVSSQNFEEIRKDIQNFSNGTTDIRYQPTNSLWISMLVTTIPWIIVFGIIFFFAMRQLRQAGGGAGMLGNFGRSRHRVTTKEHTNVTFADVAGIDEAREEVQEIVEFLKNPKRFQKLGGRIPRGVLLVGDPGCGKTLLAKAIAGEAEVPFFSISGSDFVEMFVGVGASRVRDLFRQAKENAPCIIFLDEIDAVGRRRGMGYNGGGHDEREQTLNAILVEMDGFDSSDQVIVLAATNRSDVLDPALVRPGRFDRQVFVPLPDVKGRFEILRVHARKVKISPPIDSKLQRIARATPGFSGADLAALINESALMATLAGKESIDLEDLEEARDKVRWGRSRRSRVIEERERLLTAYHEAGHALVQSLIKDADPVHKVSIIPRGQALGVTFSLPEKDRMNYNRSWLEATLRVLCAGRLAEEVVGNDANSGALGDIRQATELARRMVTEWGMSEKLGFVYYGEEVATRNGFELGAVKDHADRTSEMIDTEIKHIIDAAYEDTRRMIEGHREKLDAIAQALLKYETIDGDEVRKLLAGETIDRPTVADLIAAEQSRRGAPNAPMARPMQAPPDGEAGPLPSPA